MNIVGQRYGRLTVLESAGVKYSGCHKTLMVKCRCDCGNIIIVRGSSLKRGSTTSCGCYRDEVNGNRLRQMHSGAERHAVYNTRIYVIWNGMKNRCLNPNDTNYKNYGGRGIMICDEWATETGFEAFKKWAYENGYDDSLTLDRIDNDGNYCPENCRWATREDQNNNKRNSITLTWRGETKTLAQWAKELGMPYSRVYKRWKNNASPDVIFSRYRLR